MITTTPVPCNHIADYYAYKQSIQPCIGNNLLRRGYAQWSMGKIESYFNNLYRPILKLRTKGEQYGHHNQH